MTAPSRGYSSLGHGDRADLAAPAERAIFNMRDIGAVSELSVPKTANGIYPRAAFLDLLCF